MKRIKSLVIFHSIDEPCYLAGENTFACNPMCWPTVNQVINILHVTKYCLSSWNKMHWWTSLWSCKPLHLTELLISNKTWKIVFEHVSQHQEESWNTMHRGIFLSKFEVFELSSITWLAVWYIFSKLRKWRNKIVKITAYIKIRCSNTIRWWFP